MNSNHLDTNFSIVQNSSEFIPRDNFLGELQRLQENVFALTNTVKILQTNVNVLQKENTILKNEVKSLKEAIDTSTDDYPTNSRTLAPSPEEARKIKALIRHLTSHMRDDVLDLNDDKLRFDLAKPLADRKNTEIFHAIVDSVFQSSNCTREYAEQRVRKRFDNLREEYNKNDFKKTRDNIRKRRNKRKHDLLKKRQKTFSKFQDDFTQEFKPQDPVPNYERYLMLDIMSSDETEEDSLGQKVFKRHRVDHRSMEVKRFLYYLDNKAGANLALSASRCKRPMQNTLQQTPQLLETSNAEEFAQTFENFNFTNPVNLTMPPGLPQWSYTSSFM
ncbi:hypothetical protein K493DRAFT_307219 [Basidiobolus meristosporus CBS 931.73]|uniref:Uncharacterized protein n=1 Tax=Basidiobolus meristosporus CBS 931.73 TaxID=1314790 RepID=A0A1Y1XIQ1_9FUNG|nr:hypothetical protein K493DRAFT_307219 [Basidiobolus meristosporus CBS 931.73]|eukprot:ORX85638.1 hypothetical protein K493DRAFT_307219 [Basidiobolus meristosporus CBS 931.73]